MIPFPETKTTSTAEYVAPATKTSAILALLTIVMVETKSMADANITTKRGTVEVTTWSTTMGINWTTIVKAAIIDLARFLMMLMGIMATSPLGRYTVRSTERFDISWSMLDTFLINWRTQKLTFSTNGSKVAIASSGASAKVIRSSWWRNAISFRPMSGFACVQFLRESTLDSFAFGKLQTR